MPVDHRQKKVTLPGQVFLDPADHLRPIRVANLFRNHADRERAPHSQRPRKKIRPDFNSCAAARMRCLVCSGIDLAAGELFSVAETVPAASPRWFATVFSVTFLFSLRGLAFFFCVGVMDTPSTISRSVRLALLHLLVRACSGTQRITVPRV